MKKYLIFTITAGNGHNSAANAVKESLEKQGAEVKIVDILKQYCQNKNFRWTQEKGYALAVQYLNPIYNVCFKHFQKADPNKYYKSPVQGGLLTMYDGLLKEIYEFKPDAIFCSHFLPCVMITNLRKLYKIPCKVYSFIFDYVVCPFWEAATGIDYLLIPNETFVPTLIKKGFKAEQLLPYGLVVNEKFSRAMDKSKARERLGLKDGVFTILVMFGGGFWSGNYKIVKNIVKHCKSRSIQIIVANGRDEKGKAKIDKLKTPSNIKILNYGFSKDVALYMSAADIIVGKAGGVSVTEALNKFLPMVCCGKLPEQEKCNVKMLTSEGAAKQYKSDKELISTLKELVNNPKSLLQMRENVKRIRRSEGTKLEGIDYSLINKEMKALLKHKGVV